MTKINDLIILGAGPAGITAAIYAVRQGIDFFLVSLDVGGQTAWSGDIENYTGYQFITGPELVLKFQEHIDSFGVKANIPEEVKDLRKEDNFTKTVTDKKEYFSRSVIIATGKRPKLLGVEGESEFKNKGVTYCATCDGPLFKDKKVAIIGGGNSALEAALQMVKISPQIYMINIASDLTADKVLQEAVSKVSNVEIWNSSQVKRIYGDNFVKGIEVEREGETKNLDVEGVFIEIGLIPNSEFTTGLSLKKNKLDEIIVDCYNKTNIEGIFAAGDVTNVPEKQIIIACGEGSKASLSAFRYLSTHRF